MNVSTFLRRIAAASLGALVSSACDEAPSPGAPEEPPALDVSLVVDPNEIAASDLAARLSSLVVVVDAPEGLYEPGEESVDGDVQVKNADADPADLELVATIEVLEGRLPTFRLERGNLPDVAIDLRVLGFTAEGAAIADGSLRAARFGDAPRDVQLPFGLRPSELPPRVVDALPPDGTSLVGCSLPSVVVVFSRPVDPASLEAEGAVVVEPVGQPPFAPTPALVDASGLVATLATAELAGTDELSFRLTVGPGVRAAGGGPDLDQVPAEAGLQPFAVDLRLPCTPPPGTPCDLPDDPGCPDPCGGVECPEDPRVSCVDDRCSVRGCAATCPQGEICDEARAVCVVDCRIASAIDGCDPDVRCDPETGLCGG